MGGDGRLGWDDGDLLGNGMTGCGSSGQLRYHGRNGLRCACSNSARLGSDNDRLGHDGDDVLSYGNELRVCCSGRFSEGRFEYDADGFVYESDEWTKGYRPAANKGSGQALLARMSFDKDNPVDR